MRDEGTRSGLAALILSRRSSQLSPNLLQHDREQRVDFFQFRPSCAGRDVAPQFFDRSADVLHFLAPYLAANAYYAAMFLRCSRNRYLDTPRVPGHILVAGKSWRERNEGDAVSSSP